MDRNQLDVMWQQALTAAVKDGEMFTRYHFAALVRNAALEEAAVTAQLAFAYRGGHGEPGAPGGDEVAAAIRSMKVMT